MSGDHRCLCQSRPAPGALAHGARCDSLCHPLRRPRTHSHANYHPRRQKIFRNIWQLSEKAVILHSVTYSDNL